MFSLYLLTILPAVLATPIARQTTTTPAPVYVHPTGNTNFCLGATGDANGAATTIVDCTTKSASTPSWVLDNDKKLFQLNGTQMCLDAGTNIGDGVPLKVWQCYDNLPQQQWTYNTGDQHFSVGTGAECLDLTNGAFTNGAGTQTWSCISYNTNQKWTTSATGSGNGGGTTPPPPSGDGQVLHPNGNTGKCLDVQGNVQANGTPVEIYDCNGTGAQKWVLSRGHTSVRLAGTNYCLDAGTNIGNEVGMKIWQCYDGLAQQTWYYTDDNRIAVENKGQCLDLTGGRLDNGNQVQTWTCTDGNTNQIWN
ncbi:carbohydrate-binding module family 13 protein [Schizophyllum commune]